MNFKPRPPAGDAVANTKLAEETAEIARKITEHEEMHRHVMAEYKEKYPDLFGEGAEYESALAYNRLLNTLLEAYSQARSGKGAERHAGKGENFEDQQICEVARRVGLGFPLGQAVKKIYESQRLAGIGMGDTAIERGVAELLGSVNYLAAAIIVMREQKSE